MVYEAPFYYLFSISLYQEFDFLISRNNFLIPKNAFLDIKNSISWYQEFDFLISRNNTNFSISKNRILDIKKSFLDIKNSIFSAPEPKAQVHYCDHALSVRPSVVVNFSHFRLLWNHYIEFNETWQESRSQRLLPSLCFSGRSEKQDGRPGLWLAETFLTSPLKPLNGIQPILTGSKISTSSTKFVFFGPIGNTRWPPWSLIGWDIFDFSSQTTEQNSTKLDRKQDLNVLYQVCVFRADRKNKMAALASDWLRHFWLLLWNRWTEFNQTWQEARSQRPLPSLCFWGRSEKQDGRPGLWSAEPFSTSPLKPLNRIQRNLTGSKISTSSTKFVFLGPIGKTRWLPWALIGWDFFDFSSETAERNSTKIDRKQDLNVLYQVCVFGADRKNKMAALASDWLRHFRLLLWNRWTEFNKGGKTQFRIKSKRVFPKLKIVWLGFPLYSSMKEWNLTSFWFHDEENICSFILGIKHESIEI